MRVCSFVLLGLAAFAGAVLAQTPWTPVRCAERMPEIESFQPDEMKVQGTVAQRWKAFEAAVRRARPGSTVYAPKPYPKTRDAILENLEYALREVIIGETPIEQLTAGVRQLWIDISAGDLRVEIVRVENWVTDRCSLRRPKPFYHLVRVFDERSREYARVRLHDTGLLAEVATVPDSDPPKEIEWLEINEIDRYLQDRLGFKQPIADVQYVSVDGLAFFCSSLTPCIAFRSNGKTYVVMRREMLFELETQAPMTVKAFVEQRRNGPLVPLGPTAQDLETPLLSVGYGWARGKRIHP